MNQTDVIQVLNDPIAQELMHSSIPVRLAYTGVDGNPRVVPLGYYWNGAQFVVCTTPRAPKVRAIAENPNVAMTFDTNTFPPLILLVRGMATVEIVDGVPDEFLLGTSTQISPEQMPEFEEQARAMYKQMARIEITPHWAKVIDFETRFPQAVAELLNP